MSSNAICLFDPGSNGPSDSTVAAVVKLFLDDRRDACARGRYAKRRLRDTLVYLTGFAELYGNKIMDECRPSDIERWLADHADTWLSPHTNVNAVRSVITCFRWAAAERIISYCPYSSPKSLPTPQPRDAIDPWELESILLAARERNGKRGTRKSPSFRAFRAAVWFLWETGCRTCEVRELTWPMVNWQKKECVLKRHKTDRTGLPRVIPLTDRALRFLRWRRRFTLLQQRYVFPNGRGRPWTAGSLGRQFRKYRGLAGVRDAVTAYSCRHGMACEAVENGVSDRQLADLLGHAGTKYISWYARSTRCKSDYLHSVINKAKGNDKNKRG